MRVIAGAVLAAGMVAPGGSTCADRMESWFPDDSGAVGVEVSPTVDGLVIEALWLGKPAFGTLQNGDEIVSVDGDALAGLGFVQKVERVRGPVGVPVTLEVRRDGGLHELVLDREPLPWAGHGWVTALDGDRLEDLDGCGVKSSFGLDFEGDFQGHPVSFRLRGEVPDGNALDCVVERLERMRWSGHGRYALEIRAEVTPPGRLEREHRSREEPPSGPIREVQLLGDRCGTRAQGALPASR